MNYLYNILVHSVWFYKKRWDFTTSDSFLNFWVFPLLGFLNLKAGFLIFEEIIHWFLKNIFFCCYVFIDYQARSWRYGYGRTLIWEFTSINKGWPHLDFVLKLAAAIPH